MKDYLLVLPQICWSIDCTQSSMQSHTHNIVRDKPTPLCICICLGGFRRPTVTFSWILLGPPALPRYSLELSFNVTHPIQSFASSLLLSPANGMFNILPPPPRIGFGDSPPVQNWDFQEIRLRCTIRKWISPWRLSASRWSNHSYLS